MRLELIKSTPSMEMHRCFHCVGFTPDAALQEACETALGSIVNLAPFDSRIIALIRKSDSSDQFHCSIDVYSKHGPFIAESSRERPGEALTLASALLLGKLARWREQRREQGSQVKRFELHSHISLHGRH